MNSSRSHLENELEKMKQSRNSLLNTIRSGHNAHQPFPITFLGDSWWVQTTLQETVDIISRKEKSIIQKLSEITESIQGLEREYQLYTEMANHASDIVDIREELSENFTSNSNGMINQLENLSIDTVISNKSDQSRPKHRIAHTARNTIKSNIVNSRDEQQVTRELQELKDIFDKYEQEELESSTSPKNGQSSVPSIIFSDTDILQEQSPPASFHPSESELSDSFPPSDDDEEQPKQEAINSMIFPMSEPQESLQEILKQRQTFPIKADTKHAADDITVISSSPPKISRFTKNS